MSKIFVYNIEDEKNNGTIHDFFILPGSTHYLTNEYGEVLYQGSAEYIESRMELLENI